MTSFVDAASQKSVQLPAQRTTVDPVAASHVASGEQREGEDWDGGEARKEPRRDAPSPAASQVLAFGSEAGQSWSERQGSGEGGGSGGDGAGVGGGEAQRPSPEAQAAEQTFPFPPGTADSGSGSLEQTVAGLVATAGSLRTSAAKAAQADRAAAGGNKGGGGDDDDEEEEGAEKRRPVAAPHERRQSSVTFLSRASSVLSEKALSNSHCGVCG